MPEPFQQLQRYLLKREGGDCTMAEVLSVTPAHGVEAVQVAVELAVSAGRPSGEHVMNILARLKSPDSMPTVDTPLMLSQESQPDLNRYDAQREAAAVVEVHHFD